MWNCACLIFPMPGRTKLSGKTLATAAGKLKELGAGKLFVFVSHCENAAVKSELLELITCLYTTDSIFRETHPKIRLLPS